jgi:hypothetical protein
LLEKKQGLFAGLVTAVVFFAAGLF